MANVLDIPQHVVVPLLKVLSHIMAVDKNKSIIATANAELVCPYRARLGFARLEASAAYPGREARMRVIGIAVFAVFFLAIVYAAFDMRRDHNEINRIREECRRANSDASKVTECITDLALRRARQPLLP